MIYMFLADGFEETEALVVLDIIRRAELDIKTVGVGAKEITGSHGITVSADILIGEVVTDDMDMVILPGGMPGTLNLEKDIIVKTSIEYCYDNDKYIAAICAAPSILGHMGLLKDRKAVCFPGFEGELIGAVNPDLRLCVDGKLITARAAGVAFEFGLKIVELLAGDYVSEKVKAAMLIK